jgi:hypothetical protein
MAHLLRPRAGHRPRLRVRLRGIDAATQHLPHDRRASPAAGPSEGRALQQFVAHSVRAPASSSVRLSTGLPSGKSCLVGGSCCVIGVVWRPLRDGVDRDPTPWSRHRHRSGEWRFSPAARSIVLIRLGLQTLGRRMMSMLMVELREALISIEKEDMSVSRELGVASDLRHPHERLRGNQVESQRPRRIGCHKWGSADVLGASAIRTIIAPSPRLCYRSAARLPPRPSSSFATAFDCCSTATSSAVRPLPPRILGSAPLSSRSAASSSRLNAAAQ